MGLKHIIIVYFLFLIGCATTSITGYSDPKYKNKKYSNIIVYASDYSFEKGRMFENSLCNKFEKKGVDCVPFTALFPPTREYSKDEIYNKLNKGNAKSVLVMSFQGDVSDSKIFGYQSYGNTTYANRSYNRQSSVGLRLLDTKTRETAWVGEAKTVGQGALNVGDREFNVSIINKVVSELFKTPHFNPKK